MRYVVYTKIHKEDGTIERWYYGVYKNEDRANEVALELGGEYPVYHCICEEEEAKNYGIMNLPDYMK